MSVDKVQLDDTRSRRRGPAARYKHDHPPVLNINELQREEQTRGQRVADRVAKSVGSWPFIIVQSVLLCIWMILNVYLVLSMHAHQGALKPWDPYPFILLNLVLSFQAAYTGPVVMMSQNRQAQKDRLMAEGDYQCNVKAEEEVKIVMEHLNHQDELTSEILDRLTAIEAVLRGSTPMTDA